MFELNESSSLLSLFISAFISSTLFPGGSEVLFLYLASQTEHNWLALWLAATSGNVLGGLSTWLLGFWLAKRFPDKTLDEKKHRHALAIIRRYGSATLLFSWLPIIGDPLCFVAGWLKITLLKAAIFIAIGKAFRYALLLLAI